MVCQIIRVNYLFWGRAWCPLRDHVRRRRIVNIRFDSPAAPHVGLRHRSRIVDSREAEQKSASAVPRADDLRACPTTVNSHIRGYLLAVNKPLFSQITRSVVISSTRSC